jgi:glycerophosphoryl diester phosphodiesterase
LLPWRLLDRRLAPAPLPDRVSWLAASLYAHRGYHGQGRVENSPSAFAAAIAAGLGIECDVQQSADGQAMVFHDWELDRLTAARGPVRSRAAEALAGLRLAGSDDPIWTLPQLLAEVRGRTPLLIELKSRRQVPYAPLCLAVRSALEGYSGPVAVMSFDPRVVRWFARRAPHVVRGLVMTEESNRYWQAGFRRHLWLWRARPEFLAYDVRDLPSAFAARQRGRALPLLTWTVSDRSRLLRGRECADTLIAEAQGLAEAMANH